MDCITNILFFSNFLLNLQTEFSIDIVYLKFHDYEAEF